jgi:hypothetical protein
VTSIFPAEEQDHRQDQERKPRPTRGCRMLIVFTPAGKMEAFFREVTKANGIPPADPQLWRAHGMELIRPPLALLKFG